MCDAWPVLPTQPDSIRARPFRERTVVESTSPPSAGGELCSSNTPGLSSAQTIIAALLTLRGLTHDPGAGENTAKTIVLLKDKIKVCPGEHCTKNGTSNTYPRVSNRKPPELCDISVLSLCSQPLCPPHLCTFTATCVAFFVACVQSCINHLRGRCWRPYSARFACFKARIYSI